MSVQTERGRRTLLGSSALDSARLHVFEDGELVTDEEVPGSDLEAVFERQFGVVL